MFETKSHVGALAPKIVAQLLDEHVRTDDVGAEARIIQIVQKEVDTYRRRENISPADALQLARATLEQTQQELSRRDVATLAVKVGAALTSLRDAERIETETQHILQGYNPRPYAAVENPSPKELAEGLAPLAALAGILGARIGHNKWFASSQGNTALGPADATPEDPKAGAYKMHVRQDLMPYERILDIANDVDDALLLRVASRNAMGIENTLRGIVLGLAEKLPAAGDDFAEHVARLPDPFEHAKPNYLTSLQVMAYLERVGHDLRSIQETADSNPGDEAKLRAAFKENPLGHQALRGAQAMWAKADMESEAPRYGRYLGFDAMNPFSAVRNLSTVLAAIEGAKQAARMIGDILDNGLQFHGDVPGGDGFNLQLFLETGARWGLGIKDPVKRNRAHSRVVADESALQLVTSMGFRREKAAAIMPGVTDVLRRMSFAAGEEFYKEGGEKASAAAKIAVGHAGELLRTLHPESNQSTRAFQQYAFGLLSRLSLDDVAEITSKQLNRASVPETDKDLRSVLAKQNEDDAWFVGHLTGKNAEGAPVGQLRTRSEVEAAGQKPLDDREKRDLAAIFFACNVTWKSGQIFRGADDRTRVDAHKRAGVYDAYTNLVRARGTNYDAIYVVAKDAWEAFEKGTRLAAKHDNEHVLP